MSIALRAIALTILTATACGGTATSSRPAAPPDPGPGSGATSKPAPAPSSCPAGQIQIESCVVGGMPNEDGTANVSCGTSCSATPPSPSGAQDCQQLAPDRYRCTAYAP